MEPRFRINLLEHLEAVGTCAAARGAQASVDAADIGLNVVHRGRTLRLRAQFVGRRDGRRLMYFDVADRHATGFVGWLPYRPLAWDLSIHAALVAAAKLLGQPQVVPPTYQGLEHPNTWAGATKAILQ
jgi:hypothetical protein